MLSEPKCEKISPATRESKLIVKFTSKIDRFLASSQNDFAVEKPLGTSKDKNGKNNKSSPTLNNNIFPSALRCSPITRLLICMDVSPTLMHFFKRQAEQSNNFSQTKPVVQHSVLRG